MIAVGISQNHDTKLAFYDAINQSNVDNIVLVIVFAGARHNPNTILLAANSRLPGITVFGGSVAGIITRNIAAYSGYEIAVVVFTASSDLPIVLNSDPSECTDDMIGYSLGCAIFGLPKKPESMIMFYTSVANTQCKKLHHATSILKGFSKVIDNPDLQVAGGGLLTNFNFEDSWAIGQNKVYRHYAFAIIPPDDTKLKLNVLRACRPSGPTMTITGIDGSRVTSIDNKPALDVICLLLDRKPSSRGNILGLNLCLGLINNNKTGKINKEWQINRVIVSEDITDGSISLLEPDFCAGDQVQLMVRDNDYMLTNASVKGVEQSVFSIYIDCAGRSSILTGSSEEEGVIAMSSLPYSAPAIGVYSGVEIASINGSPTSLDLTGVMASFLKI